MATKPAAPRSLTAYVLATAAVSAHAYFLWTQYQAMVGKPDPLAWATGTWRTTAALTGGYLLVIALGKRLVAGLPTMALREAMDVYNVYLTLLSAAMFYGLASQTIFAGQPVWTLAVDRSAAGSTHAFWLWVNYQSKFLEYSDSAFMLLRKKFDQLSFLHVSHHAVMGPIMHLIIAYAPGGTSYFGPMINSGVHTIMYAYYFLKANGWNLSWKKQVTQMQLVQFLAVLTHALFNLYHADVYWPQLLGWAELALIFQMLTLFGDFYVTSYKKKGGNAGAKAAKNE